MDYKFVGPVFPGQYITTTNTDSLLIYLFYYRFVINYINFVQNCGIFLAVYAQVKGEPYGF